MVLNIHSFFSMNNMHILHIPKKAKKKERGYRGRGGGGGGQRWSQMQWQQKVCSSLLFLARWNNRAQRPHKICRYSYKRKTTACVVDKKIVWQDNIHAKVLIQSVLTLYYYLFASHKAPISNFWCSIIVVYSYCSSLEKFRKQAMDYDIDVWFWQ